MTILYTLFGYSSDKLPVVTTDVTAEEAKSFAAAHELTGFFLAPQAPDAPAETKGGGMKTYMRDGDGYSPAPLAEWTYAEHLTRPRPDVGRGSGFARVEAEQTGERAAARVFAFGRGIHMFVHADGRFSIWEGEEGGSHHHWLPMASGNLATGERWAGESFTNREA
jgi:hypothetical protein